MPEEQKRVLVVFDKGVIPESDIRQVIELLVEKFRCKVIAARVSVAPKPIDVIQLDTLPPATLEEVEKLCENLQNHPQ